MWTSLLPSVVSCCITRWGPCTSFRPSAVLKHYWAGGAYALGRLESWGLIAVDKMWNLKHPIAMTAERPPNVFEHLKTIQLVHGCLHEDRPARGSDES